jgi:Spy/CpxP family protein refolding chaperone
MSPRASRALAAVALSLSTAAFGCGASPELGPQPHAYSRWHSTCGAPPQQAVEPPAAEPEAARAPTGRLTGLAAILGDSLTEIDLRPDQRPAARAILADTQARTEPARAIRARVAAAVADDIQAGRLSTSTLPSRMAELGKADAITAAAFEDAANRLHALLDEDQRKDLLRELRSNWKDHRKDIFGLGWQSGGGFGQLKELAEDLDLTSSQRRAVRAKVRDEFKETFPAVRERAHAAKERLMEAASAFRSPRFNASSHNLGREAAEARRTLISVQLRVASALLPTLSPEQRVKLANHIRAQRTSLD